MPAQLDHLHTGEGTAHRTGLFLAHASQTCPGCWTVGAPVVKPTKRTGQTVPGRARPRTLGPCHALARYGDSGRSMTKRAGLVPQGFLFGVATAGYQIEGGYNGRGRAP